VPGVFQAEGFVGEEHLMVLAQGLAAVVTDGVDAGDLVRAFHLAAVHRRAFPTLQVDGHVRTSLRL
jgi:hypothetical protein